MDTGKRERARIGDMLAYSNLITFLFMLLASGCFGVMSMFFDTKYVFVFLAGLTFAITIILFSCVEEVRVRFKKFRLKN